MRKPFNFVISIDLARDGLKAIASQYGKKYFQEGNHFKKYRCLWIVFFHWQDFILPLI